MNPPIENIDALIEVAGHWKPNEFAVIEQLHCQLGENGEGMELIINFSAKRRHFNIAWPSSPMDYQVTLRFSGAYDLSLDKLCFPAQIMGFDIIDISDKHWENARFEIEDYEDGKISFFCKEIAVLEARKIII